MIFIAKKISGKLKVKNAPLMKEFIDTHKDDTFFTLTLDKYDEGTHTTAQIKYYWGVVVDGTNKALNHLGWDFDREQTHDWLKGKFLKEIKINAKTGETETVIISIKKLSKEKMSEYIERCIRYNAEEMDNVIPDPPYKNVKFKQNV